MKTMEPLILRNIQCGKETGVGTNSFMEKSRELSSGVQEFSRQEAITSQ